LICTPSSRLALADFFYGLIFLFSGRDRYCRKNKTKTSYQKLGLVIGQAVRDARATTNEVI